MAKSAKRKTDDVVTTAVNRASKSRTNHQSAEVTDGDPAHGSDDVYLERGNEDGSDADDWLQNTCIGCAALSERCANRCSSCSGNRSFCP